MKLKDHPEMVGVLVITVVILAITAIGISLQIWVSHRESTPECVPGEPIPPKGCVTIIRPTSP